jgi:hypothetical protein
MVPVVYQRRGTLDLRLIAFSTTGSVLDHESVSTATWSTDVTGGPDIFESDLEKCILIYHLICPAGFSPGPYVPPMLLEAGFPLPGVAIRPDPLGGTPQVVASGLHDTVVYSFLPQTGLSEVTRGTEHAGRIIATPPVVLTSSLTAVGVNDVVDSNSFLRLLRDATFPPVIPGVSSGFLTAAPTVLTDGRLVIISREGTLTVLNGR